MNEDVITSESSSSISSYILPVLISGAVGAGLALLLAPKAGSELRSDIANLARRTREEASEAAAQSSSPISQASRAAQATMQSVKEQASEMMGDESEGRSLLWPIVISGAVGAAAALLFAPKSGKEVIADIKDYASTAYEKSKDLYQQGMNAAKEALAKGKEAAAEEAEKIRPAA